MLPQFTPEFVERFWSKVDCPSLDPDVCWNWCGSRARFGYGLVSQNVPGKGWRKFFAHRVSYALVNDGIPSGMHVLHHCDNPSCVRPSHLYAGTQRDNVNDMIARGRASFGARVFGDDHPARRDGSYLRRGVTHHNAKLTDDAVREMREFYARHYVTCAQVGEMFGVSAATAHKALIGIGWKHVASPLNRRFT